MSGTVTHITIYQNVHIKVG